MEFIDNLFYIINNNWQIISAFFIIAILYSSVGFGGGSSYLAVLSLFSFPFGQLRALALICNIVVVSGNLFRFQQTKNIDWKKVFPIVLISIPLAFFGGKLRITENNFYILLALLLIIASFFMISSKFVINKGNSFRKNRIKDLFFGGSIGFISGLAGLGGGIFLAPLLHLSKWDTPKKIAASSSVFIFVNSVFGLAGQSQNNEFYIEPLITSILALVVFFGGQVGSRLSEKIISPLLLKRLTAILVLFVGIRLLIKHL